MEKGKFYGVSVGPGDPELLTLKAKKILEKCSIIAAPVTGSGNMLALTIVEGAVDLSQKSIILLNFLMTADEAKLAASHQKEAKKVMDQLEKGMDVAMLNLGDVSIYSTFAYINEIIKKAGYKTEIIPGVPSFCAVAAVLETSLTTMKKPIHIIPSDYDGFENGLELKGTKVIMKTGKGLPKLKQVLAEKGMSEHAALVANCGLENQKVYKNIQESCESEGYFATIVIKD
ncbi:MAG: precorrin-2 C(20)-methyltransferase [Clostridia bacterium]|nr:precorrin-2 C(20)-methyltransferase [Clostridia bacterium]